MDFLIPETIEHVTRFGNDIPVLNPAQISALSVRDLMDPDFYFINEVDLDASGALTSVMKKVIDSDLISDKALANISTVGLGAVMGAMLGYTLSSDDNGVESTVCGAACGAAVGFLLKRVLYKDFF